MKTEIAEQAKAEAASAAAQLVPLVRSILTHQYLEIIRLRVGREQAWQAVAQERQDASELQRKRDEQLREDSSREQKKNEKRHADHMQQISLLESELRTVKRERGEVIRRVRGAFFVLKVSESLSHRKSRVLTFNP